MKACIIIPARIGSSRLPSKVIADINGKMMIERVYEACISCKIGDVFVATDSEIVKQKIESIGGTAILTESNLPSGSDRIYNALTKIDPNKQYNYIINVQGDVPNISPQTIIDVKDLLVSSNADIATPICIIDEEAKKNKPSVVKAVVVFKGKDYGRAIYFTRSTCPSGDGDLYEHIGLYAYTRSALEKFVSLQQSPLEKRESLEQLRAIENDMIIYAKVVKDIPLSIDVIEDLERARKVIF